MRIETLRTHGKSGKQKAQSSISMNEWVKLITKVRKRE